MPRHTRSATLLGPDRRKLSVMTHSLNFSGSVSNSGSHEAPEASARGSMMENAEELHDDPTMLPPVPGPKYEQVIRYLEQKYVIPGSPGDKLPTERYSGEVQGKPPDGAQCYQGSAGAWSYL